MESALPVLLVCVCAAQHNSDNGGHNALLTGVCHRRRKDIRCLHPDMRQQDQSGDASFAILLPLCLSCGHRSEEQPCVTSALCLLSVPMAVSQQMQSLSRPWQEPVTLERSQLQQLLLPAAIAYASLQCLRLCLLGHALLDAEKHRKSSLMYCSATLKPRSCCAGGI